MFAELADPARFLGLQPLLVSLRERAAPAGRRAFEAVERIPIGGPLALRSRIRVELAPDPGAGRVAFATRAAFGIALTGAFRVQPCARGARVVESVALACPRWLQGFVAPRAAAAQEALLANLRARLEEREGKPV